MFRELLARNLTGVTELSGTQLAALEAHYELLVRWNRRLNLTAIIDMKQAIERHYCESVFVAVHLPKGHLRIADVGSGAGFPGAPVAILRPDCEVVLVESHRRKAVFLNEVTRDLSNVRVLAMRAEDIKDQFDRVISRAVSYQDLSGILKQLAPAADLLTGAEEPPEFLGFRWVQPLRLPWGTNRFLRSGARIH